jgi:hypothetical protein
MPDLTRLAARLVPNDVPPQDAPELAAAATRNAWKLEDSIFSPKPRENDSKGFYDKEGIEADVFDLDWQRCLGKSKFSRMLGKQVHSEELMARLVAELRSRCGLTAAPDRAQVLLSDTCYCLWSIIHSKITSDQTINIT